MRILKNDTADFSIEIKNLDNLYIAKVTESHIRFVYDGKRYILSKDDSDDEFMTLYKSFQKTPCVKSVRRLRLLISVFLSETHQTLMQTKSISQECLQN